MTNTILPPSEVHYPANVQSNVASLYYLKSTSSSIAGATAGILGLTNYYGFSFYLLSSILVGLLSAFTNGAFTSSSSRGGRSASSLLRGGWKEFILGGLLENLFGYVLFWTLFYALCHIYD